MAPIIENMYFECLDVSLITTAVTNKQKSNNSKRMKELNLNVANLQNKKKVANGVEMLIFKALK